MGWLINTLLTLLLGVIGVPLLAFAAGPLFGYATVAVIVVGYLAVKRSVPDAQWRSEYAWSFLAPAAGFFLSERFRRRNEPDAARTSWRLTLFGAAFLYALACVANVAVFRSADADLARQLADPAAAAVVLRTHYAGHPLEALQRRGAYRALPPERRAAVDAEWRRVQRDYYRAEIPKRAPDKSLDETRRALRYDRMRPSQRAAMDAAWKELNTRSHKQGRVPGA
jgi:hypothetical protein